MGGCSGTFANGPDIEGVEDDVDEKVKDANHGALVDGDIAGMVLLDFFFSLLISMSPFSY